MTFLIPSVYGHTTPHDRVRNRGPAPAALCAAIGDAGHGVEIWSGYTSRAGPDDSEPCSAVARVISSGEPLDIGRLIFAAAHPAMLRRLWFSVGDGGDAGTAALLKASQYGIPQPCRPADLPAEITDPYVFPYLRPGDPQWQALDTALARCRGMFTDLGLIQPRGAG
ncbi:hypothetical protein ACFCXT_04370 [Streptomyces vinaceus]|uniref:DUF7192 family protein n=1 Tax=Streptomyces vinaceus TaxID=1960 RepID=UPI0035DC6112